MKDKVFKKAKWIYTNCEIVEDQYTEYTCYIDRQNVNTYLNISCDTDYVLYINGTYVASNQYGDFEHYKIYDTIDISNYLSKDKNELKILLYYCGVNTQRYKKALPGLIFEVFSNEKVIEFSSEKTLSKVNDNYVSGQKRFVSVQLGFTFTYDATVENLLEYKPSVLIDKQVQFFKRPINKLELLKPVKIKEITRCDFGYIIDLGEEVVGYPTLNITTKVNQRIKIAYGESLESNGRVRSTLEDRSFYYEYIAKCGKNVFTNYILRLSCRYLEVVCDNEIDIDYIGIIPHIYPVKEIKYKFDNALDKDIYDICVNTLKLCMMEHYVDTPWREQCLYSFDSKNQMLCGYVAFDGGNVDYVRSNLKLLGEDRRDDGLLSICSPCGSKLTIPACSLYYIMAMKEYIEFSNDITLAKEYLYRIEQILDAFLLNSTNGLIDKFTDRYRWNFYDWSQYLEGKLFKEDERRPDLIINCLFILGLDAYEYITKKCGAQFKYAGFANKLRKLIKEKFYVDNVGFTLHINENQFTNLGNALAVLAGVVIGNEAEIICDKIVNNEYTQATLSYSVFKYDALMFANKNKYKDYILNEIRSIYKKMLNAGSTTVWETIDGSIAFDNAGSLCHGWSAIPIYIYNNLNVLKKE